MSSVSSAASRIVASVLAETSSAVSEVVHFARSLPAFGSRPVPAMAVSAASRSSRLWAASGAAPRRIPYCSLGGLAFAVICLGMMACSRKSSPSSSNKSSPAAADVILIGAFVARTGGKAAGGVPMENGIQFAIGEANAQGGAHGRRFGLMTEDNRSDPTEAVNAVTLLISHQVVGIVGDISSATTLPVAPVVEKARIPLITPAATNPEVTQLKSGEVRRYVFRTCFIDPFQGEVMAKFAREHLKAGNVAVLTDSGDPYSVGISESFVKSFRRMGGTVVAHESYQTGDADFGGILIRIRGTKPDVIFVPDAGGSVGVIALQARQLGIKAPLLGGDGWDYKDSLVARDDIRAATEGSFFSNHYAEGAGDVGKIAAMGPLYRQRFRRELDTWAVLGYEATALMIAAIRKAARPEPELIRDAIEQTRDFPGLTGPISIDRQHNARKPLVIMRVQGKTDPAHPYKLETTVSP